MLYNKKCYSCGKEFKIYITPCQIKENRGKYCSVYCKTHSHPSMKTRLKMSISAKKADHGKSTRGKLGKDSHHWIDGRNLNKKWVSWRKNRRNIIKKILNKNGNYHTFGDWETLKAQYNWTCPSCGKKEPNIKLTEDHIIPLSKGGGDNIENIQPLCMKCNHYKFTKIIRYGGIK